MPHHIQSGGSASGAGGGPDRGMPSGRGAWLSQGAVRYLDLIIRVSGVAFLVAAAYLVYGLLTAFPDQAGAPSLPLQAETAAKFALGLRLLVWSGAILAISLAVRYHEESSAGYAMAIAGALAFWGMAFAVGMAVPAGYTGVAGAFGSAGQRIGACFLVPGALLVLLDLYRRAQEGLSGRKSTTVAVPKDDDWVPKGTGFPMRCWQTSFCRPYVRSVCPRYVERAPCWRRKEGCFCEERIVFRAKELKESGSTFYSRMSNSLSGAGQAKRVLTPFEKRERCRRCPIYAEHQRLKYRLIMPLAFPAAIGILWVGAEWIRDVLLSSVGWIDRLVMGLSFRSGTAGATEVQPSMVPQAFQDLVSNNVVYWGFVAFLFVILLTWLLRFVEWLTLKVQV